MDPSQGICFSRALSSLNGSGLVPWAYLRKTTLPKGEINARDIHRNINHKPLLNTLINAPSSTIKRGESYGPGALSPLSIPLVAGLHLRAAKVLKYLPTKRLNNMPLQPVPTPNVNGPKFMASWHLLLSGLSGLMDAAFVPIALHLPLLRSP